MFYEDIKKLPTEKFKRLTGVRPEVFEMMQSAILVEKTENRKHPTRGRPAKFCLADKLLIVLIYWREYRTQESLSVTYGVSEGAVCEGIIEVENYLIKDGRFRLLGKKVLRDGGEAFETVIVDATECSICRPKKNRNLVILEKRSNTRKKFKS